MNTYEYHNDLNNKDIIDEKNRKNSEAAKQRNQLKLVDLDEKLKIVLRQLEKTQPGPNNSIQ